MGRVGSRAVLLERRCGGRAGGGRAVREEEEAGEEHVKADDREKLHPKKVLPRTLKDLKYLET